jgi:2-dehydro-3-deoxyphosphooctonate aldolase (KDO 8-P synthase)
LFTHFPYPSFNALADSLGIKLIFKSSFDKANRTNVSSFRGPGIEEGLRVLAKVKETFGVPIITDIHEAGQAAIVAQVADIIQIPAFLCRQTDLLVAAAATGKVIQIKKGQFCAASVMRNSAEKIRASGNPNILVCERGTMFGYSDLIVDPRNLIWMRDAGVPVTADITHSLQQPAGKALEVSRSSLIHRSDARIIKSAAICGRLVWLASEPVLLNLKYRDKEYFFMLRPFYHPRSQQ